ncbi:protein lifeguard 1-like [Chelonia mydas]|uniref:protein lifeguard 1-like n=1 Tax=Chelonia mydas TaxID=8469 RepID=UPI001CA86FAF|nr:protein lifeguard 1-like [Chelonia mydas]
MESEVRRRSLRHSQNKQNIEKANVHSPPAQHSEKRLPNKGSQQSSSMLNQHNNDNKDEWQCLKCSQKAFVLKVDCFTTLLLAITIGIISGLIYWNMLQGWQQKNLWFWLKLFPATIGLLFIIDYCGNNCKKFPLNLILPLMITIIEGLVLGVVSSFFAAMTVMQVGGITAFVTVMLSWVALKSKLNVTCEAVPPWSVVSMLVIFGILCIFNRSPTLQLSYALVGTLIFAIHLMKTQVRIRRESIKDQEPIDYALNLYTDIVTLFFFMLQLMEQQQAVILGWRVGNPPTY